jgi:DNA (cytosine-5)-methyltransferase 1
VGKLIHAADLFCGAGGTSTGLVRAARELDFRLDLLAVNHWKTAVATHTRNHPWARHLCADLGTVDPNKVVEGGKLDLLVASPECTHHSVARGGKPCSDQSRASAWHVLHWAERLRIDNILIENVKEFTTWGPLTKRGRPMKRRKGETFNAFLRALESLGYSVDYRVLNAADYGDATTRRRLFIQARRGSTPLWPLTTHSQNQEGGRASWRAAREIIDWGLKGESIFGRKKPLSRRTMARIEAGLRKFGGAAFLTIARGPVDEPDRFARSVDEPMPVCVAGGTHLGLAEPFIVAFHDEGNTNRPRVHPINEPLPTLDTSNRFGLAEPFIMQCCHDGGPRVRSVKEPLPTITCAHRGEMALVEPFLVKFYGSGKSVASVDQPAPTITTKDRMGLVEPVKEGMWVDIRFRMLQPHELAAAMSFDGYEFTGNKGEQVKQIGNAVPVRLATALCRELIA